jgi:Reverse transcriptase (RNA-dependent DNA polymerase)
MCTVDTVGAYLYQDYPDDATPLYLTLPANVAQALGLDPLKYYRIKKYLYGLPDSGRAYYKAYAAHLSKHGYVRTTSDPCLFIKINGNSRTYVFTHVDDTFVCSTDPGELLLFQQALQEIYQITVNDDVTEYLGIKMTKQANGDIKLTQPKLLQTIFDEHISEIDLLNDTLSPQRLAHLQSSDSTPIDQTDYLHLLGALIYITKSRPDIATAVSFSSVYASKPTAGAYAELLLIVKYLYQTRTSGLTLQAGESNRPLHLKCYVDASYLTHNDSKSHTGFCLSFGEVGSFYSKSSKQTLVATSSTHAEMRALYSLCIEIVFVVHLCEELGRPVQLPAVVLEDNQPVIDLASDFSSRAKKSKHFLMLVRYVREQVEHGLIAITKVPTAINIVDILTKIVVGNEFRTKALSLLGEESFSIPTDRSTDEV